MTPNGTEIILGATLIGLAGSRNPDMTAQWMTCNRNKRSVAIDLKRKEGREVLDELLRGANAFLHNMRPGKAEGLGLSYDALSARNPRLI